MLRQKHGARSAGSDYTMNAIPCIERVVDMVNKFGAEDKYLLCADGEVRRVRAYLDSLSMDGAEVAINCLCSVRSCPTYWYPDDELADGHRGECQYRNMAQVMEQLDAAREKLLDDEESSKMSLQGVSRIARQ